MISESLKTNTTLTILWLSGDDKIEEEKEIKQRMKYKWNDNKYNKWNENNETDRENNNN